MSDNSLFKTVKKKKKKKKKLWIKA